ncbi:MAG TPA: PIG-L deacetylase family protein [Candidatus Eisenbacteria bacterium]|nr:PIG-L deacetylase family protein [Candidatus Eisenbacteria bacterium]
MRSLGILDRLPRNPTILCLGAHCDDIEIGCGATILRLLRARRDVAVRWVVFSSTKERAREASKAATLFLKGARRRDVRIEAFADGHFPYQGAEIKRVFEELKREPTPDLIFTHYRDDRHQDHRLVSDSTWQTFRDAFILEYEIPKYDGDLGIPNVFAEIDAATCERKIRYLTKCYATQRVKPWFTAETIRSLMRIRGVESRAPRYAEAFHGRKLVL